tara:strand:+ start:2035 stop:2493 length:459 start_codon:yes stop_codon:yes gene_type:complete
MAAISTIRTAAQNVGINAIITNSDVKIEVQLNRITDIGDAPIMLINWDLVTSLEFDQNGFLKNPTVPVTCLLMSKSPSNEKDDREDTAEAMGVLFQKFIQNLYTLLIATNTDSTTSVIQGAKHTLVPKHGLGKHSGVIGVFTMKIGLVNNCT